MFKVIFFTGCMVFFNAVSSQTIDRKHLDNTNFIAQNFEFKDKDIYHKIYIEVDKDVDYFQYHLKSGLVTGDLTVLLYDPNNKKVGSLILIGAKRSSNSNDHIITANGNVLKEIDNPISGKWLLVIQSKKAIGNLMISINKNE